MAKPPGKPDRPTRLTVRELSEWGVLAPAAHLTAEEVSELIRGLPAGGLRHGSILTFDPVAARETAKAAVTAMCLRPEHAEARRLGAITRQDDGGLTTCALCARKDW